MKRFRKKPIVIEAIQFIDTVERITEICNFAGEDISIDFSNIPPLLVIRTLEGEMVANEGDWIVRGIEGEIYPCKKDIFDKTYEEVGEAE